MSWVEDLRETSHVFHRRTEISSSPMLEGLRREDARRCLCRQEIREKRAMESLKKGVARHLDQPELNLL